MKLGDIDDERLLFFRVSLFDRGVRIEGAPHEGLGRYILVLRQGDLRPFFTFDDLDLVKPDDEGAEKEREKNCGPDEPLPVACVGRRKVHGDSFEAKASGTVKISLKIGCFRWLYSGRWANSIRFEGLSNRSI
jgi:hypothetical protein